MFLFLLVSGVTLQIPPPPFRGFLEKTRGGGVSVKNFFIKDFLSKKIFRRFAPEKKGGAPVALPPDLEMFLGDFY